MAPRHQWPQVADQTPDIYTALVTTRATDINSDPGCYMAKYPDMTLVESLGTIATMVKGEKMSHPDQYVLSNSMTLELQRGLR